MKIPVQCFCGDPRVSLGYGLFLTYVVAASTAGNVSGLASNFNTSEALLRVYNPLVVWNNSQPEQYAFIPVAGTRFLSIRCQSPSIICNPNSHHLEIVFSIDVMLAYGFST